jgi:hypothetical protein
MLNRVSVKLGLLHSLPFIPLLVPFPASVWKK